MKFSARELYKEYRDIVIVGNHKTVNNICRHLHIARKNVHLLNRAIYVRTGLTARDPELIVIDIDTFGVDQTDYLVFLTSCFCPRVPLVLITDNTLTNPVRQKYLSNSAVLDVIHLTDASKTNLIASQS